MDLDTQLSAFYGSLDEFKATDHASGQLADVFNALLAEVKTTRGDHPIVAVIQPIQKTSLGNAAANCGTIRTLTSQLIAAVD